MIKFLVTAVTVVVVEIAVVVKREDDGEEYVVDWDALFQDD